LSTHRERIFAILWVAAAARHEHFLLDGVLEALAFKKEWLQGTTGIIQVLELYGASESLRTAMLDQYGNALIPR
jgi:hypothetical protein